MIHATAHSFLLLRREDCCRGRHKIREGRTFIYEGAWLTKGGIDLPNRMRFVASTLAPVLLLIAGAAGTAAAAGGTSPCDQASAPICGAALGPLRDVSAAWRWYQPALIQPVPVSDYASDPEDAPAPLGVGACGGETASPASNQQPVPPSTLAARPPRGVPAPPGSHGPYCLLRYLASDFTSPCAGCHRILLDFAAMPKPTGQQPRPDGHWAARLAVSTGFAATAEPNGHSPNIKNLCSDKFIDPAPGSACEPWWTMVDGYGLGIEGDSATFHHFPLEGRYYNGPSYLAGNGRTIPYHWVRAAYVDIAPGGAGASAWYGASYRGVGDPLADTDQSYGCACEVPPFGTSTLSPSYALSNAPA